MGNDAEKFLRRRSRLRSGRVRRSCTFGFSVSPPPPPPTSPLFFLSFLFYAFPARFLRYESVEKIGKIASGMMCFRSEIVTLAKRLDEYYLRRLRVM